MKDMVGGIRTGRACNNVSDWLIVVYYGSIYIGTVVGKYYK